MANTLKIPITSFPTPARHKLFGFVEITGVRFLQNRIQYMVYEQEAYLWVDGDDTTLVKDSINDLLN